MKAKKGILSPLHFAALLYLILISVNVSAVPKLNGMAIHSELGSEQFIAAVYTENPTSSSRQLILANESKVMEIRVLADQLYSRRFKRMWVEGIAINSGALDLEQHAQDLADFTKIIRIKLKRADSLRIARIMGEGTVISINGLHLGSINNTRFFDLLLRTWVGPVPLSSDFKQTMLANGHIAKQTLKRFHSLSPTRSRLTSLAQALEEEKEEQGPPADKASTKEEDETKTTEDKITTTDKTVENNTEAISKAPIEEAPISKDASATKPLNTANKKVTSLPSESSLLESDEIFNDDEDDQGFSAQSLLSEQLYISKLTKWTSKFVTYPGYSIRHNQEGTVRITVSLARSGKVTHVEITDKSPHDYLNRAAQKAIKKASPYPSMPDDVKGDMFRFTVPVAFRLH